MSRSKDLIDRRLRLEEDLRQLEEEMVRHASRLKDDAMDMARPGRMFKRFPVQTVAAGLLSGVVIAWGVGRLFGRSGPRREGASVSKGGGLERSDATAPHSAVAQGSMVAAGRPERESLRQMMGAELKRAIAQHAAQFFTRTVRDALEPRETERQPS